MNYSDFFDELRSDVPYIECHTSGSTGIPKTIRLPKREIYRSARRTVDFFNLSEKSLLYSCISPEYIGGKMQAVRAEVSGGSLIYEEPSNRPLSGYRRGPIDLISVVPSQMVHILDNLNQMPELRNILIGGSAIPPALRKRIAESGLSAWETYGMTETASHIALRRVTEPQSDFFPLRGIDVSQSADGCLVIELESWQTLTTNDLVEFNTDGSFRIVGRKDSIIITGGKKVNPLRVEEILEEELRREILITSLPDEKWGERVVMIIEDMKDPVPDKKIYEVCRNMLQKEEIPKEIHHRRLPRTANGKKERRSNI